MRPRLFCAILVAVTLALASSAGALSLDEVNKAEFTKPSAKDSRAVNLKAQVLLDRLGFSSGAIDGRRSTTTTAPITAANTA